MSKFTDDEILELSDYTTTTGKEATEILTKGVEPERKRQQIDLWKCEACAGRIILDNGGRVCSSFHACGLTFYGYLFDNEKPLR